MTAKPHPSKVARMMESLEQGLEIWQIAERFNVTIDAAVKQIEGERSRRAEAARKAAKASRSKTRTLSDIFQERARRKA
jgi:hypothetical protein